MLLRCPVTPKNPMTPTTSHPLEPRNSGTGRGHVWVLGFRVLTSPVDSGTPTSQHGNHLKTNERWRKERGGPLLSAQSWPGLLRGGFSQIEEDGLTCNVYLSALTMGLFPVF
ncbi:hypothetical protein DPEC_G00193260 [Dallia pectoralis]|uniref:Uncharacterized protein n=1 Tax=Dallia pectoralis TaxID=75939 RepID=A0ACC2G724_DALPE|nr:hypothetical protein DPEC_G00193260 [Dallia pectoralis]